MVEKNKGTTGKVDAQSFMKPDQIEQLRNLQRQYKEMQETIKAKEANLGVKIAESGVLADALQLHQITKEKVRATVKYKGEEVKIMIIFPAGKEK